MKTIFLFFIIVCALKAISPLDKANELMDKKNYKEAFEIYDDLAKHENVEAIYQLGRMYYSGTYVNKSYKKAHEYLEKASELGYDKASYNLAVFYNNKNTSYNDFEKAYKLFFKLAQNGHDGAQNRLGMFYAFGTYVKTDYKEAVKWFELSSKQGNMDANCNLALMYASGKGVFPNFGRAHIFAKKGYEENHPICKDVWEKYHLEKYNEDKGFKFNFYTKPNE